MENNILPFFGCRGRKGGFFHFLASKKRKGFGFQSFLKEEG
jgi:hypothetical protein